MKPVIAIPMRRARAIALARPSGFVPSHTSPTSSTSRVKLVVITAVVGASLSESCTRAFCTAIAETPSMAANIMIVAICIRIGEGANPNADRDEAGKEQKLQEQKWPQGGNPGPVEACRQK